jgi:methylornithine synthase
MADSGVHLIDLTMGEDPEFLQINGNGVARLENLVRAIKAETGLPVMISPGVISADMLKRLAKAGADWYACYQETHCQALFQHLRPGQSYDARWQAKKNALKTGLMIEEGILTGVGESTADILHSLEMMRSLKADQVRIMSFRPQNEIPIKPEVPTDDLCEPVTIAVMRLIFPDRLIPASADVDGPDGLEQRLRAGANVVTSLIPPGKGFTGVVRHTPDIDNARRMPQNIAPILAHCALEAASVENYMGWIEKNSLFTGNED